MVIDRFKIFTIMSYSIKKWYIIATKAGNEKKLSNLLTRKNIDSYCPLTRQWIGKKKVVLEPLFNCFVFICIDEVNIPAVKMIDGVLNFVYWLEKPAIINSEEIEIMKRFMTEYSNVKLEKIPFGLDRMSRTNTGQLADIRTHTISVKNNTVKIVLPSLGYNILAEASNTNAEVLVSTKKSYYIVEKYKFAI